MAIGSAANARLKQTLHSPIAAAAINFLVGFSILTFLLALGIFKSPDFARFANVLWWAFLGGFLGATFVSLSTLTVPTNVRSPLAVAYANRASTDASSSHLINRLRF